MGAGLKLVERRLQAGERLFPAAAAPVEEAEVRNDLALVMIVAQLAEDGGGLLEAVERALIVAGVAERQREVVERHRLAASVAELADEFQSVRMGSNCPLRVAAPTKVDTASVELSGLPVWAGRWRRRGSRARPPQVVGALPRDQSAARETAPPGLEGTLNHPHAPSNSAGQGVVSARARDDDNPTGEGEEREKDEGDELAEADGGEEAEDKEHEAYECGEALAQAHVAPAMTRFLLTSTVLPINFIRSSSSTSVSPPTDAVLSRPSQASAGALRSAYECSCQRSGSISAVTRLRSRFLYGAPR